MHLELSTFNQRPATHMVSLGRACRTAYNLRRYFNYSMASPLDWWFTEADGMMGYLRTLDVEGLYQEHLMEVSPARSSINSKLFQLYFHHEFPRDYVAEGTPILEGWEEHIDRARARCRALTDRLIGLNREECRIAFFREGSAPVEELHAVLETHFPRAEWTLVHFELHEDPLGDWRGVEEKWDAALAATGLSLDPSLHRPFSVVETDPNRESAE
jgi:hypothetical protein